MSQIEEGGPPVDEGTRRTRTTQKYKKLQERHCREDLRQGTASISLVTPSDGCDGERGIVLSGGQGAPLYAEPIDDKNPKVYRFLSRWNDDDCPQTDIGNFSFLAYLGGGSSGCVYAVEGGSRRGDRKVFALKILSKKKSKQIKNALQERRMCYALRHKFIVKTYAWCEDAENIYLVMSHAEHGNIKRYQGIMQERILKLVAAQIVLAIEYLHRCSVVHCNLKPTNIFVTRNGVIKVGDFGSAQLMRTFSRLQGSRRYIAPEVWKEESLDRAVDWWFMGILLYEFIHSAHPFFKPGATSAENKRAVLEDPPKNLDEDTPYCRIVGGFLNKDPALRLGISNGRGAEDVKSHEWFRDVDFENSEGLRIPLTFDGELIL